MGQSSWQRQGRLCNFLNFFFHLSTQMLHAPLNQGRLKTLPPARVQEPALTARTRAQPFPARRLGHQRLPGSSKHRQCMSLIPEPQAKPREINAQASAFAVPLRSDIKSSSHAAPQLHFQPLSTSLPRAERSSVLHAKHYTIQDSQRKKKTLSQLQRELNNLLRKVPSLIVLKSQRKPRTLKLDLTLPIKILQPEISVLLVIP